MDIEPADREVGIMEATFIICMKEEHGKQIQLTFGEDQMLELLETLKPQIEELRSQEEQYKFMEEQNGR